MPKKKKRPTKEQQPDGSGISMVQLRKIARGQYLHCHEIYGAEMVTRLRRPVRESLGYR